MKTTMTMTSLPGKFHKVAFDGAPAAARVHACKTEVAAWWEGSIRGCGERLAFPSESAAVSWLAATAVAMSLV